MLYEPCEAAVENIPCTASNSSSCEAYGNAFCDTTTCRCRDDHYDSGTACYQSKISNMVTKYMLNFIQNCSCIFLYRGISSEAS